MFRLVLFSSHRLLKPYYRLTLCVEEVADRYRVTLLDLGSLGVEHDVGSGQRAGTKVLLAEGLNLLLNGSTSLDDGVSCVVKLGKCIAIGNNVVSGNGDKCLPAALPERSSGASSCARQHGRSQRGPRRR